MPQLTKHDLDPTRGGPDAGAGLGAAVARPSTRRPVRHATSRVLSRHSWLRLGGLLSLPMVWLVIAYLGALAAMFVTAFWTIDSFTSQLDKTFTWDNFVSLATESVYRDVLVRSLLVAVAVTVIDAVLALPIAFYMAKVASPRTQRIMVVLVMTPLWASYLVKAYAWRVMLSGDGVLHQVFGGGDEPLYGIGAITVVLAYLWLPYMIIPVFAGLGRIPDSLLDASADLGGRSWRTYRSVVMPLLAPALVAGSIFTFSLSLGDLYTAKIVGGTKQLFSNVIYDNLVTANNLPFAAAAGTVPVLVMVIYLVAVTRTGALENL